MRDAFYSDCTNFSLEVCSDILQSSCSQGFLSIEPDYSEAFEVKPKKIKESDQEIKPHKTKESDQEIKQEISRQKQKYLRIINSLSELQIGM